MVTILITGATGLLGRAVYKEFAKDKNYMVLGCGYKRLPAGFVQLDLRSKDDIERVIQEHRPDAIIHCAAERRPDYCDKDSEILNIDAVWHLGRSAYKNGCRAFVHISTDYLFDGKNAPYDENADLNPVNEYGLQKQRAEYAAMAAFPNPFILRVPVLFGEVDSVDESSLTQFATKVKITTQTCTLDDWQIRVPTYTADIGATLHNVVNAKLGLPAPPTSTGRHLASGVSSQELQGIFNYTSNDRFTRYTMTKELALIMGASAEHILSSSEAPSGAARPYDCHLNDGKLRATGLAVPNTPFKDAALHVLKTANLL